MILVHSCDVRLTNIGAGCCQLAMLLGVTEAGLKLDKLHHAISFKQISHLTLLATPFVCRH